MRTIVITGAASGMGAAVGEDFVAHGDHVVGLDVNAHAPGRPGGVEFLEVDVTKVEEVAEAFSRVGDLDLLVRNAGVQVVGLVGEQPIDD